MPAPTAKFCESSSVFWVLEDFGLLHGGKVYLFPHVQRDEQTSEREWGMPSQGSNMGKPLKPRPVGQVMPAADRRGKNQ